MTSVLNIGPKHSFFATTVNTISMNPKGNYIHLVSSWKKELTKRKTAENTKQRHNV